MNLTEPNVTLRRSRKACYLELEERSHIIKTLLYNRTCVFGSPVVKVKILLFRSHDVVLIETLQHQHLYTTQMIARLF